MEGTCSMCREPVLRDMVSLAGRCRYGETGATHAAVGTSLCPVTLPLVSSSGLMGAGGSNTPCTGGDSATCTLTAVLHSVKKPGVFIHLTEGGAEHAGFILNISKGVRPGRLCVVVDMPPGRAEGEPDFTVFSSGLEGASGMREREVLAMLLRLQSASPSVIFYWSPRLLGYSVVLNQCLDSTWIVYVSNRSETDSAHRSMQAVQTSSPADLRVLPCFYSSALGGEMIVVGAGGTHGLRWNDLEVEMSALCEPVVQRVYCARAPTSRCFCCQYMLNLHNEIHGGGEALQESTCKVRLHKKFWQNVKRRGRGAEEVEGVEGEARVRVRV